MTRSDLRLPDVGTTTPAKGFGVFKCAKSMLDEESVPLRAVLIGKKNRLTPWTRSSSEPRGLEFHEGNDTERFGVVGNESRQHSSESHGLDARISPDPFVTT